MDKQETTQNNKKPQKATNSKINPVAKKTAPPKPYEERLCRSQLRKLDAKCTQKTDTLCWTCCHCTGAPAPAFKSIDGRVNCPWASEHKPVPGWDAEEITLKVSPDQTVQSFTVHSCPYYKADLEGRVLDMSVKELAKLLGLPLTMVSTRKKLSIQLAIRYIRAMNQLTRDRMNNPALPDPKLWETRYTVRNIVTKRYRQLTLYNKEMLEKEGIKIKQDKDEMALCKSDLVDCDLFLKEYARILNNEEQTDKPKPKQKTGRKPKPKEPKVPKKRGRPPKHPRPDSGESGTQKSEQNQHP